MADTTHIRSAELHDFRHIIFYAQGQYQRSSIEEDLVRIITGPRNINEVIFMGEGILAEHLLNLAVQILSPLELVNFIRDLGPDNHHKVGLSRENYSYHKAIIRKVLSVAKTIKSVDLGSPDPDVLPLQRRKTEIKTII